ncbi:hypothetical protein [Hafnia alvei]|uniref:hypothetical protein n=1 Tax=Hafnia alvei TaxID=569 RepID=UPI001034C144|nr:hypothetical protein [Hafnia alvei]TBL90060.1 hypothetical protein EYY88_00930 [Hafnia alvei]
MIGDDKGVKGSDPTCGISICRGDSNTFYGVEISGFERGIVIGEGNNNTFTDIQILSARALEITKAIEVEISQMALNEQLKKEVHVSLEAIKQSKDRDSALARYTNFMSSLSDHVTVLTPIMPLLLQLGAQL